MLLTSCMVQIYLLYHFASVFSAAKQALKYIHHLPFKKMWLLGITRGKYFEKLKEENKTQFKILYTHCGILEESNSISHLFSPSSASL